MSNNEDLPSDPWSSLHHRLQEALEKEVYLMRELLSNMHQEEISLILHDRGSVDQLLQQRSILLERLSSLRLCKLDTMKQMEHLNPYFHASIELSSLGDQLDALTEKVHRQVTTNQRLSVHPDQYFHPLAEQKRATKKAVIATLQIKQ